MRNQIKFPLNGRSKNPLMRRKVFTVAGGRYMDCPSTYVGVKMAAEIRKECVVDIPTEDFNVPPSAVMKRGLLKALPLMLDGEPLYAGCMGGIGRTGLFLAILAKTMGVADPVDYVRKNYYPHAVETRQQVDYVKTFMVPDEAKNMVRRARRKALWRVWSWHRKSLTRVPRQSVKKAVA